MLGSLATFRSKRDIRAMLVDGNSALSRMLEEAFSVPTTLQTRICSKGLVGEEDVGNMPGTVQPGSLYLCETAGVQDSIPESPGDRNRVKRHFVGSSCEEQSSKVQRCRAHSCTGSAIACITTLPLVESSHAASTVPGTLIV